MRAGLLRHRITLLQRVTTVDEAGQPVDDWQVVRSTWANVLFNSGRETIRSEKWNWQPVASCRIRKQAVSPDMRVRFDGYDYDITTMVPQDDVIDLVICRVVDEDPDDGQGSGNG